MMAAVIATFTGTSLPTISRTKTAGATNSAVVMPTAQVTTHIRKRTQTGESWS